MCPFMASYEGPLYNHILNHYYCLEFYYIPKIYVGYTWEFDNNNRIKLFFPQIFK